MTPIGSKDTLLLLIVMASCACACCDAACQPLEGLLSNSSNVSAVLVVGGGACHSACGSATSPGNNPAYTLQPYSSDTWASASSSVSSPAELAVLDLCNQVQSIWLMQGALPGGA